MTNFTVHTSLTAPEKSRELLKTVEGNWGFLPNFAGIISESPVLLRGYGDSFSAFEGGLFSPLERAVILLTVSRLNDAPYSIAAFSAWFDKAGVPAEIITALREERPLKDIRPEALRLFVSSLMKSAGRPEQRDLDAFFHAGYTQEHALEVLLGVSVAIMSNYAAQISSPVLDKAFEPHRVVKSCGSSCSMDSKHAA